MIYNNESMYNFDYQLVEIDLSCDMYGAVCREYDDPEKLGYVIAYIPKGRYEEVRKIFELIDREYTKKELEGKSKITRPLGAIEVASLLDDAHLTGMDKPIPKPLYPCHFCYDEYSWNAEQLFWCDEHSDWVCDNCFTEIDVDEKGICLADYIRKKHV